MTQGMIDKRHGAKIVIFLGGLGTVEKAVEQKPIA
jgi:hypothetical protein